jgi:hypothetical protein
MRTKQDHYDNHFYPLVVESLKRAGKKFDRCELCGKHLEKDEFELHHTKYEGASIYDLKVVCHKCNTQPENKGLK